MKVSLSWLKEYIPVDAPAEQIAEGLTMGGLEVDALTDRYAYLESVCVGRIIGIHPHPKADRLKCCEVSIGDRTLAVVCGAPNAAAGLLAPLALPGTHLPDGTVLTAGKIRGVLSEGMLCSAGELGLGPDRSGIMVLDADLAAGTPLAQALHLSDPVLEIDLTPNRPDCLSVIGAAREIAAARQWTLTPPAIQLPQGSGSIDAVTSVTIDAPDDCPRYSAILLEGITVGPSPFWLQDRLLSVGMRPINNLVDITNFVMMETGQPLHAFDFDRLEEHRIVVRTAAPGETFTTLDNKARALAEGMLLICDGRKPVAIAGVMGGLNSEIEADTQRVLIESACFSPTSIRRTAKQLGLKTEASHRFERGVDPEGTLYAMQRAAQLMIELGGGRRVGGLIDAHPRPGAPVTIRLSLQHTNRHLGTSLKRDQVESLLTALAFSITVEDDDHLLVSPPSFRVDVARPEDLIEEVARLYGYNHIPATNPLIPAENRKPARELDTRSRIKVLMTGFGFNEAINYSFMDPRDCDRLRLPDADPSRSLVAILNPLTEEQAVMRTSLLPGLLGTMHRNVSKQIKNLKFFETGKVYLGGDARRLPLEIEMLAGLWSGNRQDASWLVKPQPCDFYDIKGAVEDLLADLGVGPAHFSLLPAERCYYLMAGTAARIVLEQTELGLVGAVHPRVLDAFHLEQAAFAFELNLSALHPLLPTHKYASSISRFPSTSRDITIIVDRQVVAQAVVDTLRSANESLIEDIFLFDVFEGPPIPDGKKSISLRVTYRSFETTLEDSAINRLHKDLTERLLQTFNAALPA